MINQSLLLKIHHVQITVPKGAEDEARKFYREFLGLKEIPKPEILQGRGGFWLEAGGFQLHVGTEDGVDRSKSKAHVAFEVTDLKGWLEKLNDFGVEIIEGVQIPGFNRVEFRDPFGNRVEFLERI